MKTFRDKKFNLSVESTSIGKKRNYLSYVSLNNDKWNFLQMLAPTPSKAIIRYEKLSLNMIDDLVRLKYRFEYTRYGTLHNFSKYLAYKGVNKNESSFSTFMSKLIMLRTNGLSLNQFMRIRNILDIADEYIYKINIGDFSGIE